MSTAFETSQTRLNLMRAFAGESQARNRYTFAAELAQQKGLQVIHGLFTYTARQEQAHAKVFLDKLVGCSGQTIQVDGTYPVDLSPDLLPHLRAATHNEYQEWEHDYAAFGGIAQEEGFPDVATIFAKIGAIEKTHGDRFLLFGDLLEQNKLFAADSSCRWLCLNCGHIEDACVAPAACPVCKHPQGWFIRAELSPFD